MSFEIEEPKENRFTIKEPKKVPNYNQNPIMPYLTEKPGDENLIDDVVGGAEAGLSFATGMTALPIAGLAGLWQSGFGMYPEKGAETVEKVANYLTYKPTTTKGQETFELINKPLEYLEKAADWAGNKAYEATGRAEIGAAVKTGMMFAIPGVVGKGIKLTFKTALNSIPEGASRDSFRKTIIQESQRAGETVDQTTNRLLPVPVKEKTPVMPVNSKGEVLYEKPLPAMSEEAIKQAMVRVANQKVKKGKSRVTVEEGEYPIADPTLQAQAIAGRGAEAPWVIEEPGTTPTTNLVKKMSGDSSVTLGSGPWQSMYEKFFGNERIQANEKINKRIKNKKYSNLDEAKTGGWGIDFISGKPHVEDPYYIIYPPADMIQAIREAGNPYWGSEEFPIKRYARPNEGFSPELALRYIENIRKENTWITNKTIKKENEQKKIGNQPVVQTGFYSKLGEVINNKVGGRITPDQLFKVLKNNGVKDSEIKWAGLNEFRDTYKDQLVTKEQLTNYLKEHELIFQDVDIAQPKFQSYTGGEGTNYQERLITFKTPKEGRFDREGNVIHDDNHWSVPNSIGSIITEDIITPDGKKVLDIREMQSDWDLQARKAGGYDVLKNGWKELEKKGYKVEKDLESEGYHVIQPDGTPYRVALPEGYEKYRRTLTEDEARNYAVIDLEYGGKLKEVAGVENIPEMPFKDKWYEVVLKRLIQRASEEGYDYITWPTGKEVADRYQLNRYVDEISWDKSSGDSTLIELWSKRGDRLSVDVNNSNRKIKDYTGNKNFESIIGKNIGEVIGNDISDKIMSSNEVTGGLKGLDLVVSPEGKSVMYDKMLPSFMKTFAEKNKGKFGEEISTSTKIYTNKDPNFNIVKSEFESKYPHGFFEDIDGTMGVNFEEVTTKKAFDEYLDTTRKYLRQIKDELTPQDYTRYRFEVTKIGHKVRRLEEDVLLDKLIISDRAAKALERFIIENDLEDMTNLQKMKRSSKEEVIDELEMLREQAADVFDEASEFNAFDSELVSLVNLLEKDKGKILDTSDKPLTNTISLTPELKAEIKNKGMTLYSGVDLTKLKPFAKAFMEFWKPTSTLPHGGATYLDKRYKLLGSLDLTERAATNYYEELAILDPDSKIKIFQAIDGTIPKSALTKDQKVLADRITELNNQIGKMAVDEGLMSEETFKANKDNYIHYMYLRHILGENTVGASSSGTAKMDLSWAKQRKDLTPEQRAEIGLIEDISIAQPIGMAKTISDIHMNRFFNSIAADPEVTWQPRMVKVDGKNWGIGRLVQEVENQRRLARKEPKSVEIKNRLDKLEDALDDARANTGNIPDNYTQIPESSRYGDLSGAYVLKPIARDIMPVWNGVKNTGELSRMVNEFIKFEERAMAAFKIGKTALNIPTASRNVVSNFLQLNMSGMSIPRVIEYVIEALRHYSGASPKLSLARENGLLKTNFAQGEIGEILTVFEEMNKSPLGVWKNAKKLANYYGKIDDVFKMAKFLEQLDKGKDVPIAIREAQKWGMDYSLAHPLIKLSRRHIAPFVTYQYKIAPLVAESLYKRPWVIGKYIASVYGINEAVKSMMNLDENDWKRLRSMLPSYIRKNNTFVVVPWKSPEGGVQWVNLEYFFPWQSFNAIGKSMIRGDVRDIPNQLGIGHPLMDVLYTLSKSSSTENPPIDMFTHREIYNRLDSPTEKAAKTSLWVFQKWLPTMLTTEGTAGKITKAALGVKDSDGRVMGWDKALLSLVGVNINNPSERAANIEQISTINSWRKDLLKIARSNASEAKKAQAQRMFENKVNKYLSERFGGNQ